MKVEKVYSVELTVVQQFQILAKSRREAINRVKALYEISDDNVQEEHARLIKLKKV